MGKVWYSAEEFWAFAAHDLVVRMNQTSKTNEAAIEAAGWNSHA